MEVVNVRRYGEGNKPRKGEHRKCERFVNLGRGGYLNVCGQTGYSCERAQKEGLCERKAK
jgi:hypothetical protein